MEDLILYWAGVIDKDLSGFADPRTKIDVDIDSRFLNATWIVRGHERKASFRLSTEGDFRWLPKGDTNLVGESYRSFLVAQDMADFNQLCKAIEGSFQPEPSYVSTQAMLEGENKEAISDDLLYNIVDKALYDSSGKTKMLFVKGDAGTGKTTLLRHLTGLQARKYKSKQSDYLFLYVSAQGRSLSNLRDAISGVLDDLRAGFTRDAVYPLVRHGLLVPIIDGFDELLGVAGYGDAFGSLQNFLSEVKGRGSIIVSARSAFYDIEFIGKNTADHLLDAHYDVEPITLLPWGDKEIHRYLALARNLTTLDHKDQSALDSMDEKDRSLLSKPFFASRFPEFVDIHNGDYGNQSLLEYLVDAYVKRESSKIVDRDGNPLVPIDTHRQLFIEATEYMWQSESRDLGEDELRALAEFAADATDLIGDAAQQFIAKISSYHGFRTDSSGGRRRFRFEHEVYFDYFLSNALRVKFTSPISMSTFIDRGIIPDEIIDSAIDINNAIYCFELLDHIKRNSVLQENRRQNLGSIIATAIKIVKNIDNINLSYLSFINVSFELSIFNNIIFNNCNFNNINLSTTKFYNCKIDNCLITRIIVSDTTHLDIKGIIPGGNLSCIVNISGEGDTYVPSRMSEILSLIGTPDQTPSLPILSDSAKNAIELLQRVVQKYRRTNILCLEDDTMFSIFRDPYWETLLDLLIEYNIVKEETRATSGTTKHFFRPQVAIINLLKYETVRNDDLPDDSIGNFWRSMRLL